MSLLTDSNAKRHVIVTSSNTAHAVRRPALHTHTHTCFTKHNTHRRFRIECERDSRRHVSLLATLPLERTRGSRRHDVQEHIHLREKRTTISQQKAISKYFYCRIDLIWTNACSNTVWPVVALRAGYRIRRPDSILDFLITFSKYSFNTNALL